MLKTLTTISESGEKVATKAILLDVSYSTQFKQSDQPFINDPKSQDGYIVYRAIVNSFQAVEKPLEIEAFLDEMCEEGKEAAESTLMVTIGNGYRKPWKRWTRDTKSVAEEWYQKARCFSQDIGNGTYYVQSIETLQQMAAFSPSSRPSRLVIRCDGLAHDEPKKLSAAFEKLLQSYPLLIVDVEAFVLAPPPSFDSISATVAGIDIYNIIPKHCLSSFKATYLLADETNAAETLHTYELAVSNQRGARFSVAGVSFEIPATDTERLTMIKGICTTLCDAEEVELAGLSISDMRDCLQNIYSISEPLLHLGILRDWLSRLLTKWLASRGYEASPCLIDEHLNKLLFKEKSENVLSEVKRIRGQKERKATFEAVLKYWERGNPIFGACTYGTPALVIPCDDLVTGYILSLSAQMQLLCDVKRGLVCHKGRFFMIFPCLTATALANDDYARMAIRRVVSEGLEVVGCGPAAYWAKRIDIVAIVAILAAQYRIAHPTSPATRYLRDILVKLLDKEQANSGYTSCSALTCLKNSQSLPTEHTECALLKPNPRQFLRYALGWHDGAPPLQVWPEIKLESHLDEFSQGDWTPKSTPDWQEILSKSTPSSSSPSLASLVVSIRPPLNESSAPHETRRTEQIVINVPGCLSSGKSSALQITLEEFPVDKFFVMTSEDAYFEKIPPQDDSRILIFDHHPDLVTRPGSGFRPELGRICTQKDSYFIQKYNPRIILINTNARDAIYLGLNQKPFEFPGTLRNEEKMMLEDWKDFLCFCVGNAEKRTEGFRPCGPHRVKWFEIAKRKLNLPRHMMSRLDIDAHTPSREINERRERYLQKGNKIEDVKLRGRHFAQNIWSIACIRD